MTSASVSGSGAGVTTTVQEHIGKLVHGRHGDHVASPSPSSSSIHQVLLDLLPAICALSPPSASASSSSACDTQPQSSKQSCVSTCSSTSTSTSPLSLPKFGYPSAGSLNPVQVHIISVRGKDSVNPTANATQPLDVFYLNPERRLLQPVDTQRNSNSSDLNSNSCPPFLSNPATLLSRSSHSDTQPHPDSHPDPDPHRPALPDVSACEWLILVGERAGIEPVYGDKLSLDFMLLECGYVRQAMVEAAALWRQRCQPQPPPNSSTSSSSSDRPIAMPKLVDMDEYMTIDDSESQPHMQELRALLGLRSSQSILSILLLYDDCQCHTPTHPETQDSDSTSKP